ncbi:hypothetical protein G8759_06135 [Spirosoma aureum]|uniref:Uncharacterized protein n=1 Tax=Spirosoma aureum TaxID=2692134 RepID=A0A6G9AIU5_9BACT|nr:hypothetical protein [Spirosoma aureum]QIP12236.1 hypothetical protein G8759_06135 [Spirosoma aureum]
MQINIDPADDAPGPQPIIDPMIKRFATKLHELTWELVQETEHYALNRPQIDQLIDSLKTFRAVLVFAEDLERLDAMLRMTFPGDYYGEQENVVGMLTDYSLSGCN